MEYVVYLISALGLLVGAVVALMRYLQRDEPFATPPARHVAGLGTAALVFVLTYLSAWAAMPDLIILGDSSHPVHLRFLGEALAEHARTAGHYPDSLDELRRESGSAELDHYPYYVREHVQYEKTDGGFRLELDELAWEGDLTNCPKGHIVFRPTLSQFLYQGRKSATLFFVAFFASSCAGCACYAAGRPRRGRPASRVFLVFSMAVMTVFALAVTFFLVLVYTLGEHH